MQGISTSTGINGVRLAHHTSQVSMVTYHFYFKTVFGREHSGKFPKNSSVVIIQLLSLATFSLQSCILIMYLCTIIVFQRGEQEKRDVMLHFLFLFVRLLKN